MVGRFVTPSGWITEDPRGRPCDNGWYGVEATLPVAAIARLRPGHPILSSASAFWVERAEGDLSTNPITDRGVVTAEGAYTVAYPLAVLGRTLGRDDLVRAAVAQLLWRERSLWDDGVLCLRRRPDGLRTYRGWARAYAWYGLGLVRTLGEIGVEHPMASDLSGPINRWAASVVAGQRADGLWPCFLFRGLPSDTVGPEEAADTAGSAGVGAALSRATRLQGVLKGALHAASRMSVERGVVALAKHVTSDGLLSGASASNRDGERLQRSGLRVVSPYAAGLAAQLVASERLDLS